jgi:hypothetical protein
MLLDSTCVDARLPAVPIFVKLALLLASGAPSDFVFLWRLISLVFAWSLRGRRDRGEKMENRGQIFSISRRIVVLFNEKPGKYGPIPAAFAVDSFCRAGS